MRTLTLRIYLTVVAVLLLFAFVSGWLFQRHMEQERLQAESVLSDRMAAWADLIQRSLPHAQAANAEQEQALLEWSQRLRLPLALDAASGERIGASPSFVRRMADGRQRTFSVKLEDGRMLWVMRPGIVRFAAVMSPSGSAVEPAAGQGLAHPFSHSQMRGLAEAPPPMLPFLPPGWPPGLGVVLFLSLLFVAVAAGAWPVARALTRRLHALKQGVEHFGAGSLSHRVEVAGHDEVAALATSFNHAAERIEALVRSHQSLLANASHELRSPLARLKMAVSMLAESSPVSQGDTATQAELQHEINTNIAELDALVEEVLLASRLDSPTSTPVTESVDLVGVVAEEAARVNAVFDVTDGPGGALLVEGEERLLRRAVRNLLENAQRYGGSPQGGSEISAHLQRNTSQAVLRICDRGPGVPTQQQERIFEPFYRLPGHAEQAGGVGLGLSLVKQIAHRHHGTVHHEAREGGGSCFVLSLPC